MFYSIIFPHKHSSGAPLTRIVFRDSYRYKPHRKTFIAAKGRRTGAFVYYRKKAAPVVGNVLPLSQSPEGDIACNVEEKSGGRGALARTSGDRHSPEESKTRICLPSGAKKTVPGGARAAIGVAVGGGRIDKPLLKTGRAYHKQGQA